MNRSTRIALVLVTLLSAAGLLWQYPLQAGQWSITAGLQTFRGNYVFRTPASTVYFTGGLNFRTERFLFSASLPVVGQNSTAITNSAGLFMPNGEWVRHPAGRPGGHRGGMMDTEGVATSTSMRYGVGDLYFYGEWLAVPESGKHPSLSLTGQVKAPTASKTPDYGTGKLDYGFGLAVRKTRFPYLVWMNLSYVNFGDPDGVVYRNPLYLGIGAGRSFAGGKFLLSAYYEQYSEILTGYTPPRQVTLTSSFRLATRQMLSLGFLAGFSESSPDWGVLTGLEFSL